MQQSLEIATLTTQPLKWLKAGRDIILPLCAVIGSIVSVYLAIKAK